MTRTDQPLAAVFRHSIVLPATAVLDMSHFPRRQDLGVQPMRPEMCRLVIFVSHRWEDLDHPDPTGSQLRALQSLIHGIGRMVAALGARTDQERRNAVPSLATHGALQAALLAARLLANAPQHWSDRQAPLDTDDVMAHIGIWYDYACLPQKPRSPSEQNQFAAALMSLPGVVQSEATHFLALRQIGDDYEQRGWCLAEAILAAQNKHEALVLRTDRLGDPFRLSEPQTTEHDASRDMITRFRDAVTGWEQARPADHAAPEMAESFFTVSLIAPMLGDTLLSPDDSGPLLTMRTNGARLVAWLLAQLLVAFSAYRCEQVDARKILLATMTATGLRCAADNDLVYVGLIVMIWGTGQKNPMRRFFEECLRRHGAQDSLVVTITPSDRETGRLSTDNFAWTFA